MTPARRNNWLPSIFNDYFDNDLTRRNGTMSPSVNIIENDEAYLVEIAAPGMTKDDFKVDLHDDNHLVVHMEKQSDNEQAEKEAEHNGRYLRRDFTYTSFEQSMILPENVEHDDIDARVVDGVLTIRIPKKKEEVRASRARQINVG